jgi:Mn-dependent DtxR family transcriptional regulator
MQRDRESEYRTVRGYELESRQENELTPSMEDYLEMTCRLCLSDGYTRGGELSRLLNVRPPSASKMIARLEELGYLKYDRYESVTLTEKGRDAGVYLIKRHNIIQRFLELVGSGSPLEETELIEHSLSAATVSNLAELVEFFNTGGISKSFIDFKRRRRA